MIYSLKYDMKKIYGAVFCTVYRKKTIPFYLKSEVINAVMVNFTEMRRREPDKIINTSYISLRIHGEFIEYFRRNEFHEQYIDDIEHPDMAYIPIASKILSWDETKELMSYLSPSIVDASKRLGVSRPTIYKRINKLIDEIKIKLKDKFGNYFEDL